MKRKHINIYRYMIAMASIEKAQSTMQLTVKAQGSTVKIRLIGIIFGNWSDEIFRSQMDDARASGAKNIDLYVNSAGGNVFTSNEIANIIDDFATETGGTVNGRGGALVASAASYIAVKCHKFVQARNGQFMIHKVRVSDLSGTADEIEMNVKPMRNMEDQYAEAYSNKSGKTVDAIKALYDKGDYWMTAEEARDMGFIDGITGEEEITEETVAMFAACGRPAPQGKLSPTTTKSIKQDDTEMDLKLMAVAVGLSSDATEAQITARANQLRDAEAELKVLKTRQAEAAVQARNTTIEDVLKDAVKDMRIHADAKGLFKTRLEAAAVESEEKFNAVIAEIKDMPAAKSLASGIVPTSQAPSTEGTVIAAERADWTFADWQKKDAKGWEALAKADDPEALRLYNEHHNTKLKSFS